MTVRVGDSIHIRADVCVIGAGAGGAVAAAELAEGGMDVVVLEEGHWHDPDRFTARPPEMLAQLYRDGGQTMTLGPNAQYALQVTQDDNGSWDCTPPQVSYLRQVPPQQVPYLFPQLTYQGAR